MASHVLRLVSSLLLTRLLLPEAFGLISVVQTLLFTLSLISDVGLTQAVVKHHARMPIGFMGTVRTLQLIRGVLLSLALLGCAALLSQLQQHHADVLSGVFADQRLVMIVFSVTLIPLIQALEPVDLHRAVARMETGLMARVELSGQVAGLLVSGFLARLIASPWALIAGAYASALCRMLIARRFCIDSNIPLHLNIGQIKQIWQEGRWILLSSLLGLLASQSDKLIAASFLSPLQMGYLSVALALLLAPQGLLSALNSQFVLPTLTPHIEENTRALDRIQGLMDLGLGFTVGILVCLGPLLVILLYGAPYAHAGQLFGWLSLGLLGMRYQALEQLMIVRGHSYWVSLNNALRTLTLWFGMPWAYHRFGQDAIVWVMVVSQYVSWVTVWIYQMKNNNWSMRRAWRWPLSLAVGLCVGWCMQNLLLLLDVR